jgi:hypothetical protein
MSNPLLKTGLIATLIVFLLTCPGFSTLTQASDMKTGEQSGDEPGLVVLWTSADREVALKMAFMYTLNAKKNGWWKDITLIVWGPSARLASEDREIQEHLKAMKEQGIVLEACKACTDMYGVSEELSELGVDIKWMGVPLTDYLKGNYKVLTF